MCAWARRLLRGSSSAASSVVLVERKDEGWFVFGVVHRDLKPSNRQLVRPREERRRVRCAHGRGDFFGVALRLRHQSSWSSAKMKGGSSSVLSIAISSRRTVSSSVPAKRGGASDVRMGAATSSG